MMMFLVVAVCLLGLTLFVVQGFGAGLRSGSKPGPHNNWRRPGVDAGNRPAYLEATEGGLEHHGGSASGGGAE